MPTDKFRKRYKLHVELSFIFSIIAISLIFYLYPRFAEKFSKNAIPEPDFIIIDIPPTIQLSHKVIPVIPEISSQYEEIEMMEDVEIVDTQIIDSTIYADSTLANLLYYEDFLPYLGLEKFDPKSLKEKKEPLDQYHEYLSERLTKIFENKYPIKSRSNVDDILARSMGRDPNMLKINIGETIESVSKYMKSNANRNIYINNIINTENDWFILATLWDKNSQTVFEIYEDESIRKENTVSSLKESLNNLEENGLVIKIDGYERKQYFAAFQPDEIIDVVNRFLAGNLTDQQHDTLSSFINFIIMNS